MQTFTRTDWRHHFTASYQPHVRRWKTPGQLARALDPQTGDSLPLQIIDRELVRLSDHAVPADALMITMPPQEGKARG